jgi:hypothetical protein
MLAFSLLAVACRAGNAQADVSFHCPVQLAALQQEVSDYLQALEIPATQVVQTVDTQSGELTLPPADYSWICAQCPSISDR